MDIDVVEGVTGETGVELVQTEEVEQGSVVIVVLYSVTVVSQESPWSGLPCSGPCSGPWCTSSGGPLEDPSGGPAGKAVGGPCSGPGGGLCGIAETATAAEARMSTLLCILRSRDMNEDWRLKSSAAVEW